MLVRDVGVLWGAAGRSMGFPSAASVCVTGFGCCGNFYFIANWTAFPVLSGQCPSSCSALMMGHVTQ